LWIFFCSNGFPISDELFSDSRNILRRFLYEDLIPDRKPVGTISFLEGEEREAFLDLAKGMLVWHPDARKTAGKLMGHPFLQPKQTSA